MKFEVTRKEKVNVMFLQVSAGVRYWEDATVNGKKDVDGNLIPFRYSDYWKPRINIETGQIVDWPQGTTASIHYKVCDDGVYKLIDVTGHQVFEKEGYVPNIMCPKEDNDGDYIIMDIDENGIIQGWNPDLSDFEEEE